MVVDNFRLVDERQALVVLRSVYRERLLSIDLRIKEIDRVSL